MALVLGPIGELRGHALAYAGSGLEIFPANPNTKAPLTSGGMKDATVDLDQVDRWWDQHPAALIAHRIPPDVVILDIDPRHGGNATWQALKTELGGLPVTRVHASGRGDGGGHVWWLRPDDKLSTRLLDQWARDRGLGEELGNNRWTAGIDLLQHSHRYTILPPSPHPDSGQPYQWVNGRGLDIPPAPMPALLADLLTDLAPVEPPAPPRPPDPDSIADWYTDHHAWPDLLSRHGWRLVAGDGNSDGSRWRHPKATSACSATVKHGCLFVYSPNTPFEETTTSDPHGYTLFRAWGVLDHHGDLSAAARAAREMRDGPAHRDDLSWIEQATSYQQAVDTPPPEPPTVPARLVPGGTAILDAPTHVPAIWGNGSEVLWAEGESLIVVAPPGVGKTTLSGQVVFARIGILDSVLGWPITPTSKRLLYLACDRPQQILRSLRRLATEEHRDLLNDRLVIWKGPPPRDIAKHPDTLLEMADTTGADTVVVDSIKDIAIGISEDEVGAGLNRAFQQCLAHDIDLLALHHQRKGQNGNKPTTLEDVYGSTWITAGAGSVLLLWGAAGDPIVELTHLKQPVEDIGPIKLAHDHTTGHTEIHRGFDPVAALRHAPSGLTALELTRLQLEKTAVNDSQTKKMKRRLDRLVSTGHLHRDDPNFGGAGGSAPARYYTTNHWAEHPQ